MQSIGHSTNKKLDKITVLLAGLGNSDGRKRSRTQAVPPRTTRPSVDHPSGSEGEETEGGEETHDEGPRTRRTSRRLVEVEIRSAGGGSSDDGDHGDADAAREAEERTDLARVEAMAAAVSHRAATAGHAVPPTPEEAFGHIP